ncbi:MAG: hypothetical protein JNG83_02890 [Opitutaceae bacterium]|nr:hypothetical protein [Opitutaceae bacterium]
MLRRGSVFWLSLVLAVGSLRAVTTTNTHAGQSVTVNYSFNSGTGELAWSYTIVNNGDNGTGFSYSNGAWIYFTTGAGGGYGTLVFDVSPGGSGGTNSGVVTGVSSGQWFRIGARVQNTSAGGSDLVDVTDYWQTAAATYKTVVTIPANNTDRLVRYEIKQDGVQVDSVTTAPGDPVLLHTVTDLPNNHAVTVEEVSVGFSQDPDTGIWTPTSTTVRVVGTAVTPVLSDAATPTPTATAGPTETVTGQPPPVPAQTSTTSTNQNVWTVQTNVEAEEGSDSDMSIKAYREGVDKLSDAARKNNKDLIAALLQVSEGQVARDTTRNTKIDAVKTAVDTAAANVSSVKTSVDAVKGSVDAVKTAIEERAGKTESEIIADNAETATAAASAGATAASTTSALFPTLPTSTGYTIPTAGDGEFMKIAIPASFGGGESVEVDFNPFKPERMGPVAAWFKIAMEWAVLIAFASWLSVELGSWMRGLSTLQQAKGNTVAAGTGAQATALVAATAITVAVVTAVTALLAWSFGGIDVPLLVGKITVNPVATMSANVLWFLQQFLPIETILACALSRMTFPLYAATVFSTCMSVVRFIVP